MARALQILLLSAIPIVVADGLPAMAAEPSLLPAGKAEQAPVPMVVCPGLGKGSAFIRQGSGRSTRSSRGR